MERIHIETTQNVTIEHNIASVGERILAQLLDFVFICLYLALIFFLLSKLNISSSIVSLIVVLPVFFYSLLCELIFDGQTFGKMIIKIKVVKLDGTETSFLSYFLRWVFKPIDVWFLSGMVGIITIIVSKHAQRFGDMTAGTTLINLNAKTNLEDTILKVIPENYVVQFPQVALLSEKDINVIHEVLSFCKKSRTDHAVDMAYKTKNALINKMQIPKNSLTAKEFLETVLTDYNYLNRQ